MPQEITGLREVGLELKDGASLEDVIATLRRKIPTLAGYAFHAGEDRLMGHYGFNIGGHFYLDGDELQLQDGDHMVLLPLAAGG
jgi:molybdopterin converting factor small subunit